MPHLSAPSPPPSTELPAPAACVVPDEAEVSTAEEPARVRPAYQKYAVSVLPSPIDGLGAFAAESISARRKIGEIRGESVSVAQARIRATRSERIMIVELSPKKAIDFSRSADPMRYTNHSCAPNARLCIRQGRVEFYALRNIAVGEEITVDYGETHHEGRLACRCGAPGCVGRL